MRLNRLIFIKQYIFRWDSQFPVEDSSKVLQLLNMRQTGTELRDYFIQNRLVNGVTSFHCPIKRNNLRPFTRTGRTIKIKIGRETSIFQVNRNIMPKITSWSVKPGKAVDFKGAVRYLLCPVPLSIAFSDGSKRSTAKGELLKGVWVLGVSDVIVSNISQQTDAYILNVMAKIRCLYQKSDTFKELALKLINCFPEGVNEVHCVGDSYLHNSIKAAKLAEKIGQL